MRTPAAELCVCVSAAAVSLSPDCKLCVGTAALGFVVKCGLVTDLDVGSRNKDDLVQFSPYGAVRSTQRHTVCRCVPLRVLRHPRQSTEPLDSFNRVCAGLSQALKSGARG